MHAMEGRVPAPHAADLVPVCTASQVSTTADLILYTIAAAALPDQIKSVAAFAGGATLLLFKYSRAEDAKVTLASRPLSCLPIHARASSPNSHAMSPRQLIFAELGWNYTFNGVKSAGSFVPKSSKGVPRCESPQHLMATFNGVISTLGLAPMTMDIQNFLGTSFVVAPSIIGQVLDDAGVETTEIQTIMASTAAIAAVPSVPSVSSIVNPTTNPSSPAGSSASHAAMMTPPSGRSTVIVKDEAVETMKTEMNVLKTKIEMLVDLVHKNASAAPVVYTNALPASSTPSEVAQGTEVIDIEAESKRARKAPRRLL